MSRRWRTSGTLSTLRSERSIWSVGTSPRRRPVTCPFSIATIECGHRREVVQDDLAVRAEQLGEPLRRPATNERELGVDGVAGDHGSLPPSAGWGGGCRRPPPGIRLRDDASRNSARGVTTPRACDEKGLRPCRDRRPAACDPAREPIHRIARFNRVCRKKSTAIRFGWHGGGTWSRRRAGSGSRRATTRERAQLRLRSGLRLLRLLRLIGPCRAGVTFISWESSPRWIVILTESPGLCAGDDVDDVVGAGDLLRRRSRRSRRCPSGSRCRGSAWSRCRP